MTALERKKPSTLWPKGTSGNAKGRTAPEMTMSKAMSRAIAERTRNGQDIVDRLVYLGIEMPTPDAASKRIAIAALEILAERGAGKALQEVQLTLGGPAAAPGERYRALTDAELDVADKLFGDDDPDEIEGDQGGSDPDQGLDGARAAFQALAGDPIGVVAGGDTVPERDFVIDAESSEVDE